MKTERIYEHTGTFSSSNFTGHTKLLYYAQNTLALAACNIRAHSGKSSVKALVNKPTLKIAENTLFLLSM